MDQRGFCPPDMKIHFTVLRQGRGWDCSPLLLPYQEETNTLLLAKELLWAHQETWVNSYKAEGSSGSMEA